MRKKIKIEGLENTLKIEDAPLACQGSANQGIFLNFFLMMVYRFQNVNNSRFFKNFKPESSAYFLYFFSSFSLFIPDA